MKRTFTLVLLFLVAHTIGMAQRLVVDTVYCDYNDLTASIDTLHRDNEKDKCALIKVYLARPDAKFKSNVIGVPEYSYGIYEVYVTHGTRWFEVNSGGYHVTIDFKKEIGDEGVQKACTYVLELSMPNSSGDDGMTFFTLRVIPNNAALIIDDEDLNTLDSYGIFSKRLKRGRHHYKLSATGYKDKERDFMLGSERVDIADTLESVMANLTVRCATVDADIYVNYEKMDIG